MLHVQNGLRAKDKKTKQKTTRTKTPERSLSIATRYWYEQFPTKHDCGGVVERVIEVLVRAMKALNWCCAFQILNTCATVACRN